MNILEKKPLWQMTGEELLLLLLQSKQVNERESSPTGNVKQYVYGLSGLRQLLNCSHVTAQRIKNSGKIDGCYSQVGRKLIFDADAVLTKLKNGGKNGK